MSSLFDYGDSKVDDTVSVDRENIMNTYNRYKDFSKDELMDELKRITKSKRQDGSLNGEVLNRIASTLRPYLSAQQSYNLDKILEELDG